MRPFGEWYLDYNVSTFILPFRILPNWKNLVNGTSIGELERECQ